MRSDEDGKDATKNLGSQPGPSFFPHWKAKDGSSLAALSPTGRMSSSPELDRIDRERLPMNSDGGCGGGFGRRERDRLEGGERKGGVGDCEANDRNKQEAWGARAA